MVKNVIILKIFVESLLSLNLHGITNISISEEIEDTKEESESVN
jgi:hypothetical protein